MLEGVEHHVLPLLIGPRVVTVEGVLSEVLEAVAKEAVFSFYKNPCEAVHFYKKVNHGELIQNHRFRLPHVALKGRRTGDLLFEANYLSSFRKC